MGIRDILSQSEELDRDIPEEEPEQPEQNKETPQEEEPQDDGTPVENAPVDVPETEEYGDTDFSSKQDDPDGDDDSAGEVYSDKPDLPSEEQDREIPNDPASEPDPQDIPNQDSPPDLPDGELPELSVNDIRAPQMTDMQVDTGAPEIPESEAIPQDNVSSYSADMSPDYPQSSDTLSDSPDQPQSQPEQEDQNKEFSSKLLDNRQNQADDIAKSLAEEFRPMFEQSIERNKQAARDFMNMMISQQQLLGDE